MEKITWKVINTVVSIAVIIFLGFLAYKWHECSVLKKEWLKMEILIKEKNRQMSDSIKKKEVQIDSLKKELKIKEHRYKLIKKSRDEIHYDFSTSSDERLYRIITGQEQCDKK